MRMLRVIERESPEEYSRTLEAQLNLLEAKIADPTLPDMLVMVEHREVYTTGRGEPFQMAATMQLKSSTGGDIPWIEVGRGGKATFHGPGQLVAYPIFDLNVHGKDVHVYLRKLEQAGIRCLAKFGIVASARAGLTGIWTKNAQAEWKKIASIGVGVKRWVTYHGMAINVSPELRYFQAISACGQDGTAATSLAELFAEKALEGPQMDDVRRELQAAICEEFQLEPEIRPELPTAPMRTARPDWLKVRAPGSMPFQETNDVIKKLRLVTVCEEAMCPNIGECWSHHTATFMIMGDMCTRRCSFCSVKDGSLSNLQPLDPFEPHRVAMAIQQLKLEHVVITSVNRDDVDDMGALHFDQTVRAIRKHNPACRIELLIPDMRGNRQLVQTILQSGFVSVLNHNVETVPRLYRTVRPGANIQRSLNILRWAKELHPELKTKSGVMVGLGETREEVLEVMDRMREHQVEILTIGQYLQPTAKQLDVQRFVTPEEFADYKREGFARGFSYVESGPLVRSSYHAWQHADGAEAHTVPA